MTYRAKLLLWFLSLVALSCGMLLLLSLRHAKEITFGLIQNKVYAVAVTTAPRVDGDQLMRITDPSQDGSPDYKQIRDTLRVVRDANKGGELPIRFIYTMRPLPGGDWEYVVDAEENGEDKSYIGDLVEFASEEEKPDLEIARADDAFATDSFGTWLSAFAPIRDSKGNAVAVLGVDVDAGRVSSKMRQLAWGGVLAMLLSIGAAVLVGLWLSRRVTAPLRDLQEGVKRIGSGDLSARVETKSTDEFGVLGSAINEMAEGLEERESLKGALVHYVRSQAADRKLFLGEGEMTKMDSEPRTRPVTVLAAELTGFGKLATEMGSERLFALLNDYFSTMIDLILRHRGALEKSTNESVLAVFGSTAPDSHQERHAVEAAISMHHALAGILHEWNVKSDNPVYLRIGIHTADALLSLDTGREEIDGESIEEVNRVAESIKDATDESTDSLVISGRTAERISKVFPMGTLGTAGAIEVFRVAMPKPVFR